MRPRVFPAENPLAASRGHTSHTASMRPRVFPAENLGPRKGYGYFISLQ